MCGIIAVVERSGVVSPLTMQEMRTGLDGMAYRGPDGQGVWSHEGVALGHRRLSIIDLSSAGAQPFHDLEAGLHITFNGEIYNYRELRHLLETHGFVFHSQSDTEVILAAYTHFGDDCVRHFRGMFAFVLFDEKKRRALVARDRLGKKPLYFRLDDRKLIISSEIKTFGAFSDMPLSIDRRGVEAYFALQFVPGPGTIYTGVRRLAPGSYMTVDLMTWGTETKHYWRWQDFAVVGTGSSADVDALDHALQESIRYRMIADVDVGVLLSGGVDSTLIACYAAQLTERTVKAFTVAFSDSEFDESRYAGDVARSLGLDLITMLGSDVNEDLITRVAYHAGEPLGDPACIPTYMISDVLSQHVKVVLSGEGADELFWGYPHYRREQSWLQLPWRPRWDGIPWLRSVSGSLESSARIPGALNRMAKVAVTPDSFGVLRWVTVFGEGALSALLGGHASTGYATLADDLGHIRSGLSPSWDTLGNSAAIDIPLWLPDDLLVKVDRMTMAHGVEARAPFLDHSVVELALGLPPRQKLSGGTTKSILRRLLRSKLSGTTLGSLAARPKHGFEVPVQEWLTGKLAGFTDDLLAELCGPQGVDMIDARYVDHLWGSFRKHGGSKPFARKIWLLLAFALWHHHHRENFGLRTSH